MNKGFSVGQDKCLKLTERISIFSRLNKKQHGVVRALRRRTDSRGPFIFSSKGSRSTDLTGVNECLMVSVLKAGRC